MRKGLYFVLGFSLLFFISCATETDISGIYKGTVTITHASHQALVGGRIKELEKPETGECKFILGQKGRSISGTITLEDTILKIMSGIIKDDEIHLTASVKVAYVPYPEVHEIQFEFIGKLSGKVLEGNFRTRAVGSLRSSDPFETPIPRTMTQEGKLKAVQEI